MLRKLIVSLFLFTGALQACGRPDSASHLDVTDVAQSSVKRQAIGNCWAYAVVGWIESLHLAATGQEINISESYISYWAAYEELMSYAGSTELQTGGSWDEARRIILKYGYLLEGEFIPGEQDLEMSVVQGEAESYINEQLQGGALFGRSTRTARNVKKHLDKAFGVNIREALDKAHDPTELVIGKKDGAPITLGQAIDGGQHGWTQYSFPQNYGMDGHVDEVASKRQALLKRVLKALNDEVPVIMSMMVDFNGLDLSNAMFRMELLQENGPGERGGHMVVLEDYVVDDVPGVGKIDEGEVDEALQEKALHGTLLYFKAKNSWGTKRPERGLTDGYTRFEYEYLTTNYDWATYAPTSALMDFVLPPGY